MTTPAPFTDFAAFEAAAHRQGYDAVLERHWPAGTVLDRHTHDFAVWAQVSRGEMWLTLDGRTRHLQPGDVFTLEADVPHAERYGDAGASYWVARRTPR